MFRGHLEEQLPNTTDALSIDAGNLRASSAILTCVGNRTSMKLNFVFVK